jgi:hypothetical protein
MAAGPVGTAMVRDRRYIRENTVAGGDSVNFAASPVVPSRPPGLGFGFGGFRRPHDSAYGAAVYQSSRGHLDRN